MEYEIPDTEQGLKDFVNYSKHEIDRRKKKIIKLEKMAEECHRKLEKFNATAKSPQGL